MLTLSWIRQVKTGNSVPTVDCEGKLCVTKGLFLASWKRSCCSHPKERRFHSQRASSVRHARDHRFLLSKPERCQKTYDVCIMIQFILVTARFSAPHTGRSFSPTAKKEVVCGILRFSFSHVAPPRLASLFSSA